MKACDFLVMPELILELKLKNRYNSKVYKHSYYGCYINSLHWSSNICSLYLQVLPHAFDAKYHVV